MNIGLIGLGYWGKNILNLIINDRINKIYVYDKIFSKVATKKIAYITNLKHFYSKDIDIFKLPHQLNHILNLFMTVLN